MMKVLKCKKGMTIIELVIAMILFVMLTIAVSAVFAPMMRAYAKANEIAECNTLLDNIANQMISDMSEVTKPLEDNNSLPVDDILLIDIDNVKVDYSIDSDGIVLKNGAAVLSKNFYKDKSIKFSCSAADELDGKAYILTVAIFSDENNEQIASRDYAVKPLFLNQY